MSDGPGRIGDGRPTFGLEVRQAEFPAVLLSQAVPLRPWRSRADATGWHDNSVCGVMLSRPLTTAVLRLSSSVLHQRDGFSDCSVGGRPGVDSRFRFRSPQLLAR